MGLGRQKTAITIRKSNNITIIKKSARYGTFVLNKYRLRNSKMDKIVYIMETIKYQILPILCFLSMGRVEIHTIKKNIHKKVNVITT